MRLVENQFFWRWTKVYRTTTIIIMQTQNFALLVRWLLGFSYKTMQTTILLEIHPLSQFISFPDHFPIYIWIKPFTWNIARLDNAKMQTPIPTLTVEQMDHRMPLCQSSKLIFCIMVGLKPLRESKDDIAIRDKQMQNNQSKSLSLHER